MLLGMAWFVVLGLFLWINRLNLLFYFFSQTSISLAQKLGLFFGAYKNVFLYGANPLMASLIVFSLVTAVNLVLLVFLVRQGARTRQGKYQAGALSVAVGSHVLSCGGTLLLAPIFPALAGTGAIIGGTGTAINQGLGTIANVAGILLMVYSIRRTSRHVAPLLTAAK